MSQQPRVARARRRPLDRVWVVVADGGRARVLGVTGDGRGLAQLREITSVDARRSTRDLLADRPGRGHDSATTTRHAVTPRQDAHEQARERFLSQLAIMLSEDNRARQFDELILIVAPGLSATLRDALDEPTRARVRQTLVKDFTKVALQDIHDRLVEARLLPPPADTP